MRRASRQLELGFRTWGGKREGAGRKPTRTGAASHRARPALASRFPVHVTLSTRNDLPTLRTPRLNEVIERAFRRGKEAAGFRLTHYSIQRHHLHLIVEAKDAVALSRGIQGLAIRVAKAVNRALGRRGQVFVERYFGRILKTPKQVKHCLLYVLNNVRRHASQRGRTYGREWIDPCSSGAYFDGWREAPARLPPAGAPPVAPARTWLLRVGWRRKGLIAVSAVPGA